MADNFFPSAAELAKAREIPGLEGKSYIVAKGGRIYFAGQATKPVPPSSTSKMMAMYVHYMMNQEKFKDPGYQAKDLRQCISWSDMPQCYSFAVDDLIKVGKLKDALGRGGAEAAQAKAEIAKMGLAEADLAGINKISPAEVQEARKLISLHTQNTNFIRQYDKGLGDKLDREYGKLMNIYARKLGIPVADEPGTGQPNLNFFVGPAGHWFDRNPQTGRVSPAAQAAIGEATRKINNGAFTRLHGSPNEEWPHTAKASQLAAVAPDPEDQAEISLYKTGSNPAIKAFSRHIHYRGYTIYGYGNSFEEANSVVKAAIQAAKTLPAERSGPQPSREPVERSPAAVEPPPAPPASVEPRPKAQSAPRVAPAPAPVEPQVEREPAAKKAAPKGAPFPTDFIFRR